MNYFMKGKLVELDLEEYKVWHIFLIELICSFFITFYFYCCFIDFKSKSSGCSMIVGLAALYGGFKISFPKLSTGVIFLLFNYLNNTQLFVISLLG